MAPFHVLYWSVYFMSILMKQEESLHSCVSFASGRATLKMHRIDLRQFTLIWIHVLVLIIYIYIYMRSIHIYIFTYLWNIPLGGTLFNMRIISGWISFRSSIPWKSFHETVFKIITLFNISSDQIYIMDPRNTPGNKKMASQPTPPWCNQPQ